MKKAKTTNINLADLQFLIVDDDPVVLKLIEKILINSGANNVSTANDGLEGIQKLAGATGQFDLILCDLNMPEINGIEFLHQISELKFNGGILLLSGEDNRMLEAASRLAQAQNLNVIGTIPKQSLITDTVTTILENYRPLQSRIEDASIESISEDELRTGLSGDALMIYFQPKIAISTHSIIGVEVLARWKHEERGILSPVSFISLAEKCGLIHELTYSVYEKALQQARVWQDNNINLKISINISVNTFALTDFTEFITNTAKKFNIDPSLIILEVTESEIMTDVIKCLEIMMNLRMKKFGLSIDDFGTGHSSLEKLKSIPFTELKIDRSFVRNAARNSSSLAILETSSELAKKLKMEIVAEGVESKNDWDIVENLNCDYVQGYYCAKPMPDKNVPDFIDKWKGPHQ